MNATLIWLYVLDETGARQILKGNDWFEEAFPPFSTNVFFDGLESPPLDISQKHHSDHLVSISQILYRIMRYEIQPRDSIIGDIRLHGFPQLRRTILDHASAGTWSLQGVGPTQHCEVCQGDLIRVSVHDGWHAEVIRLDGLVAELQLEIAAVVEL